uniref:Integrase catalytic domain-containing protein n=1 Tax=Tanacetum cinerariifolium TaxID=118510 RepID=A0A6L2KBP1_TANCI|nr:hypothetical protein [Tanacetum cinerariifolium]
MFVIEQPIPLAPAADSAANVLAEWNAVYDAYNKVACLMLGSMTPKLHRQFENYTPYKLLHELKFMFEKQDGVERFDLIQTFYACKQKEGKPVPAYVLKIKGYVEQLERLGYVLPQDVSVGLILNGLTSDFARFMRNYNMHYIEKTIGEQHVMLIEYEKGLPKKTETTQVMALRGGKIQKTNKKSLKAKDHPAKDDTCHHCKEVGHWKSNCPVYLFEFLKKKKQVETASFSVSKNDVLYFNAIPRDGIYEIDMHNLVPNVNKKRIEKLQQEGLLKSTDDVSFDQCVSCLSRKMTRKSFPHHTERATDLLGIIHTDVCGPLRHVSRQGASYFITFTDDYSRVGYVNLLKHKHEFFKTFKVFKNEVKNQLGKTIKALRSDRGGEYISQEFKDFVKACGIVQQLTPPYTPQHNDAVRHSLGDLNEPTSYKAIMLDPESNKWLDTMNAKLQSMIYNKVWVLVDLLSNCKTVGSKWIFKKKTNMDGILHTYKARLVANGYTQLYEVDYEETFSPVDDIRAIMILISLAAFYDYEIWKMDVKTAFLNGYLDEDIYMVQPKGFFDPKHFKKVCKLQRSIYGLKQASRSWNKRFGEEIKKDRSKRLIILSQSAYMDKILKRYRIDNSTRGHIPMQERLDLNKTQGSSTPKKVKSMQNVPYASVVGYIIGDIKNETGYVFVLNGGAVDWKSSKQSNTAMSATEAEYIAASKAAMEAIWIKKFISGLGIVPTINEPIKMFCNNFNALLIANELGVQKGARHYHIRYHYVRECIELGEINLLKVYIDDNLADPFTKALPKGKLTQHARSIGLCLASSFMWICVLVFG